MRLVCIYVSCLKSQLHAYIISEIPSACIYYLRNTSRILLSLVIVMARLLSETDIGILKTVAPECEGYLCSGSGMAYRSILPPLANHYAKDAQDFLRRIKLLSRYDLEYLVRLILSGEESLGCVPFEYIELFIENVSERLGEEMAAQVRNSYNNSECPD